MNHTSYADFHSMEAARHLARSIGVPFVDLNVYRISPGVLRRLPRDVARSFRCVPMVHNVRRIVLVHDNPADAIAVQLDRSRLFYSSRAPCLEFVLTTPSALNATLTRLDSLPG